MGTEREKHTRTASDKLYAEAIAATKALPTTSGQGVEINPAGLKGPRYLSIGGKMSGANMAACRMWPCFWNPELLAGAGAWVIASSLRFSLDTEVQADTTDSLGNSFQIVKPSWATRFYPCIPAGQSLGATNILNLVVEEDT